MEFFSGFFMRRRVYTEEKNPGFYHTEEEVGGGSVRINLMCVTYSV